MAKVAICVVVTFSCLPDNNKYYSKGASLHQVTVTTVRHNPQAFLIEITDLVWEKCQGAVTAVQQTPQTVLIAITELVWK